MKESLKEKERRIVEITGIVQGVGFRPAVYRLAKEHHLKGFVRNDSRGVTIDIEGDAGELSKFIDGLEGRLPPRASIQTIEVRSLNPAGYGEFKIDMSKEEKEKTSLVSPDIATCSDCLGELLDEKDRRFRYPFINCTNCGPRFTIVKDIPYDREKTTMSEFMMCQDCAREYENPEKRRFHAQPNACHMCGPQVFLEDGAGSSRSLKGEKAIRAAVQRLREGEIVAVKGLGGFHFACDALNSGAVERLRGRKYREDKPFALMAANIQAIQEDCYVSEFERRLLESPARPIVLLRRRKDSKIAADAAPGQKYLGFMLPYTPLHHLLLKESGLVLVMTSGNLSDEPISYDNPEARQRLKTIADHFLLHNREIETRCDDSVTRELNGSEFIIRRSRGYSPNPITLPFEVKKHILSCGAELKNTFCVARDQHAFVSHHIGDLKNVETFESFTQGIEHYSNLFSVNPQVIAYDLHPDYLSTKYAKGLDGLSMFGIQHHHAHIAAVMAENGIEGEVIGVALDGTGYGEDGNIWGCEFMVADYKGYKRVGHLDYVPMPGGDSAIAEPYRMAVSHLYGAYGDDMFDLGIDLFQRQDLKRIEMLVDMIKKGFNSPLVSSAGRLFDAVSSILGIRDSINYEGQAAVELEMAAAESNEGSYSYEISGKENGWIVDTAPTIRAIVDDYIKGVPVEKISDIFHNTMAEIVLDLCWRIRGSWKLDRVALSGGVFQNMFLLSKVYPMLTDEGFKVYVHHQVPTNDGGISLGQVAVTNSNL
ncbi:carbamoyltransferase HypF [candidate division TA06 bacterium]|uniref:Carbamoyltransferase n=1 Tax=candidate division TA06 bacterium TaxID=2250710 RepID=A0A523USV1_UNCT6|nr:MAG: carbamoyltransferase HypF [candidate division TA06 bacterium]